MQKGLCPHCLECVLKENCVWFPGDELNVWRGAHRLDFVRIVWSVFLKRIVCGSLEMS